MTQLPTLVLDFDGVLHAYTSGWQGIDVIADEPVHGAMAFLDRAVERFDVAILSSRSREHAGRRAMKDWLATHLVLDLGDERAPQVFGRLSWPRFKPPAHLTLDDRAMTFTGEWPDLDAVAAFTPWNRP